MTQADDRSVVLTLHASFTGELEEVWATVYQGSEITEGMTIAIRQYTDPDDLPIGLWGWLEMSLRWGQDLVPRLL